MQGSVNSDEHFSQTTHAFLLKLLSKDQKLGLDYRLGLQDVFGQGRVQFKLKKVKDASFQVNLSKVDFQRAITRIL